MLIRLAVLASVVLLAECKDPRGIPPSRSAFYKRAKEFQCLDGSARIPYEHVNDDYCDCADGSDEPGTSACPNGRYYCANIGHDAEMVMSSRVNDRICDCCDGSDEFSGDVSCPNTCNELGQSVREERERRLAMQKAGWDKRRKLVTEGYQLKKEKEAGIADLRAEKETMEPESKALKEAFDAAAELEKGLREEHTKRWNEMKEEKKKAVATILFEIIDANKDGKITADELKAQPYVDVNRDGVVDDSETIGFLAENGESDLEHFISNSFGRLRQLRRDREADEKRREQQKLDEPAEEPAHEEHPEDHPAEGEDVVVEKHDNDDDDAGDVDDEQPPPVPLAHSDGLDDDVPYPAHSEEYNKATQALNDARIKHLDHDSKMQEVDTKIADAEAFSSLDFGEDLAWAPLKGKCIEYEDGQYVYKLCPFEKCSQKEKNGHGETGLGNWKEWDPKYASMMYTEGQKCWNGPARSTRVTVECGDEDQVIEASEPGRCEYHFTFRTPAACTDPEKDQPIHQEL